jgi:hypothetical protein
MNISSGYLHSSQAWLISFTTQLRTLLPQGTYILTHARMLPNSNIQDLSHDIFQPSHLGIGPIWLSWTRRLKVFRFSPSIWGGGGYLKVHASVGNLIDWYNVQVSLFLLRKSRLLNICTSSFTTVGAFDQQKP